MEIYQRHTSYAPSMMVTSESLNVIQDRDIDIVKKALEGVAAFLALCSDSSPKTLTFYYFDAGESGSYSEDGAGELARVALPDGKTVDYEYTSGNITKITLSHGAEVRELVFSYNANGDPGTIVIQVPTP